MNYAYAYNYGIATLNLIERLRNGLVKAGLAPTRLVVHPSFPRAFSTEGPPPTTVLDLRCEYEPECPPQMLYVLTDGEEWRGREA